ncbi:hypothetical protein ACIBAC_11535 [Streptomyces sp. NPDC051362]|uniref:hypothetical protein n=1 Tax=Streptomyces sp. NPDC051362 TaxID=3365651 RepID=UPI003793BB71
MPDLKITHQSVHDYIAAKKRGDRATTDRIIREASARFARRDTDGSEMAELGHASMHVTFGEGA